MSHHFIEFKNVHYKYSNGYEALRGISFRITHGEKVALLGLNGAGKSTILLHTNGLILPTSGEVNIGGFRSQRRLPWRCVARWGCCFRIPTTSCLCRRWRRTWLSAAQYGLEQQEVERRVRIALERVGMEGLGKRAPFQLSGGQKKSIALATILSMEPDILVMDEPTSELDLVPQESGGCYFLV